MKLMHIARTTLLALTFAFASMLGCTTVPATGERQLNLLSEDEEIEIGQQAAPQFIEEGGGELEIPEIAEYVDRIGHEMAAESERPDLPWEFTVLETDQVNAFALPGGKIFLTRGILSAFDNEAQLAGVLGHEIAHVTAHHIGQRLSRAMLVEAGLAAAGAATEAQWIELLGGAGGQLYLLSFSRDQESQADELGLRYMTNQGYDPQGMLQVLEILDQAAGHPGGIEWLNTHPLPQTRIDRVSDMIATDYAHTQDNPDYRLDPESYQRNVLEPLGVR